MLAGCSSSSALISPRHRLRSEAPSPQFQASCHFPMNTAQRLDLPCTASFSVVGDDSMPKPKPKPSCSLRQSIRLPPLAITAAPAPEPAAIRDDYYWDRTNVANNAAAERKKGLKRSADDTLAYSSAVKRKKRSLHQEGDEEEDDSLSSGQFWLNPQLHFPLMMTCSGSEDQEGEGDDEEEEENFPFPANPWIDSAADLGEKSSSSGGQPQPPRESGPGRGGGSPSASSAAAGNGSRNPSHYHHHHQATAQAVGPGSGNGNDGGGGSEEEGLEEMVRVVEGCVEAMEAKSVQGIGSCIARLGAMASPRSPSTIHRLMAYYTEALALRAARLWPHLFHLSPPRDYFDAPSSSSSSSSFDDDSSSSALTILNQMTPIPRFIHFTANEMIMRAFEGKDRVHVIDFDIRQGLQWPSLLQSLAARRPRPPCHVRITGVGDSKQELNHTGDRLAAIADSLGLPFDFHAVVDRLEDVRLWMLHVKDRETVAVNLALQLHRTLHDPSAASLRDFLALLRSAAPAAVVLAEQEADHDGQTLPSRVSASLRYYAAAFDAVAAAGAAAGSAARARAEEAFGREIRDVVACEGAERLERHVGFATWRRLMEVRPGGFRLAAAEEAGTAEAAAQGRMLLRMYGFDRDEGQNGYFVREQEGGGGGVTLGWVDQPLFTVSCWAPIGPS